MFFIILMGIIKTWYHFVFWPTIKNPYTYVLLALWAGLTGFITCGFLYLKDQYRMQYLYKNIAIAIFKSTGYGLFFATLSIGLYNKALFFAADSKFFTPYKDKILNLASHLPWETFVSQTLERRMLTVLFLLFSSAVTLYFVVPCCYQLQDRKNYQTYAGLVFVGSFFCYLICMFLGYI